MNKFEKMEELKIAMMRKTSYRDGMPNEVVEIVKEAFDGVLNIYNNMACNNSNARNIIRCTI